MHLERWRSVAAALAIAAMTSGPAAARGRECAVEASLHWVDVAGLAPFAYASMADETRAALAGYGVCAHVSRSSPGAVRTNGEIGVVLLRAMPGSAGQRVLGATRSRAMRNATVWIYFDEVAAALGLARRPTETWTGPERAEFGRALGRVAAHEIVHALLPGRPHDRAGLMSPSFGRRELTASVLNAHPALRADLLRANPQP
jgi:hypothetical protein